LHEEREQLTQIKQSGLWALPSFSVAEVQAGFKSHPDIIRTEVLTAEKQNNFQEKNLNYD
jgi:cytochrome c oxidase subunit 3